MPHKPCPSDTNLVKFTDVNTIVRNTLDIAINIKVAEAFLGSASELENKILDSIMKNGLDISKCRGQGYDGVWPI